MALRRNKMKVLLTIIGVLGLAGFGAAYYLGYITDSDINRVGRKAYYETRGAIDDVERALTAGSSAKGDYAAAAKCRENIRQIETAKRAAADRNGQVVGYVSKSDIIKALGHPIPKCPSGGIYTINPLVSMPKCSVGSAGAGDPKDDHFVNNW